MWFHVSRVYLGKSVKLTPKVPSCVSINSVYQYEEGDIPHICVSDSIFKCLIAIMGIKYPIIENFKEYYKNNPFVYMCSKRPYIPPNASDFRFNKEMWYLEETKFIYIGCLDMYSLLKNLTIAPTNYSKTFKIPRTNLKYEYKEENINDIFLEYLIKKLYE